MLQDGSQGSWRKTLWDEDEQIVQAEEKVVLNIDGTACVPRAETGGTARTWARIGGLGLQHNTPKLNTGRNCRARMLWRLESQKP